MNAGDLRERFMEAAGMADSGQGCPSSGEIWDAVSGEYHDAGFPAILDHTAACPACASTWRLARDLGAHAPAADSVGADAASRAAGWRRWGVRAAAVAAAIVALVMAAELYRQPPPEPVFRTPELPVIRSLTAENSPLPRDGVILRWSAVGMEGTRYSIRVLDQDLRLLSSARHLEQAEYRPPAAALAGLPSGATVLWQIEAILPDGRKQTSDTFLFRIE